MPDQNSSPLFSIIIPAYNYAGYLPDAVSSVLCQDGDDFEIIIVDDGSTDLTPAVAEKLVADNPVRVRYRRQDNAGPGAARNRGVREAHGLFCLFLDADDALLPGALATFRAAIVGYSDAGLVLAGHLSLHPDGCRRRHPAPKLARDRRRNFVAYLRKQVSVSNGASLVARRVFDQYGFPENIRNGEDVALFAKTFALYDCISVPTPVVEIRKHGDSLRNRIDWVLRSGERVVEHVFNPELLPQWAMAYRTEFRARQLLSLFRSCYLAGEVERAKGYYQEALRLSPRLVFNLPALRKYLRLLLR